MLSSGSCCFDRESRSRRDCWALFFHSKMLPLDKTSCVCSRHGAAVNTPAVYLLHIFLRLDYCCGTNILASGFKIFGSTKAVLAVDVRGMMSLYFVRVDYPWFIKLVCEIFRSIQLEPNRKMCTGHSVPSFERCWRSVGTEVSNCWWSTYFWKPPKCKSMKLNVCFINNMHS